MNVPANRTLMSPGRPTRGIRSRGCNCQAHAWHRQPRGGRSTRRLADVSRNMSRTPQFRGDLRASERTDIGLGKANITAYPVTRNEGVRGSSPRVGFVVGEGVGCRHLPQPFRWGTLPPLESACRHLCFTPGRAQTRQHDELVFGPLLLVQTGRVGLDGGCFRSPVESNTLAWRPSPMTGGRLRRRSPTGENIVVP